MLKNQTDNNATQEKENVKETKERNIQGWREINDVATLLRYMYLGGTITIPGLAKNSEFRYSMRDDYNIYREYKSSVSASFFTPHFEDLTLQKMVQIVRVLKEVPAKDSNYTNRFEEIVKKEKIREDYI